MWQTTWKNGPEGGKEWGANEFLKIQLGRKRGKNRVKKERQKDTGHGQGANTENENLCGGGKKTCRDIEKENATLSSLYNSYEKRGKRGRLTNWAVGSGLSFIGEGWGHGKEFCLSGAALGEIQEVENEDRSDKTYGRKEKSFLGIPRKKTFKGGSSKNYSTRNHNLVSSSAGRRRYNFISVIGSGKYRVPKEDKMAENGSLSCGGANHWGLRPGNYNRRD